MTTNSSASPQKTRERRNSFTEVSEAEKQLWKSIHSQGLLHNDVKYLYHKACCIYEKLFLRDNKLPELQNIEYLLWRLHYKHIDEFRKRILLNSSKEDGKSSTNRKWIVDAHLDGFKMFLSGASKFYEELIRKIKRYYGLVEEPWFYNNDGESGRIEQMKLHKCQFLCHRLCICIGDLARYSELYEKSKNEDRNWSVAASYYFEAAKIYPDGGNPQNQLAVLATYIGDEFLALYHCVRSLAVKEPFPDALQNLILLFERNRSNNIGSLTIEEHDISERVSNSNGAHKTVSSAKSTAVQASDQSQICAADLWPLFIRTTSFFFLETSLDSFPCTSTSTLRVLEELLALDVSKLSSEFESYQSLNMSKSGPYRALHIISVLLFIIHNLAKETESSILKPKNEEQQSVLMKFALTFTFNCMGRFADRCLKGSPIMYFPLLPALLVFVEWLVHAIDKVHIEDEKCERAVSYFFSSLVKLLNHLQENRAQVPFHNHIALWEDYELRGFVPLSSTQASLDFSSHWEEQINYKMKNEYRAYRIIQASTEIANNSEKGARKWLTFSEKEMKFKTFEGKHSNAVDEEEDIVFKPITRRNSEPIPPLKGLQMQALSSDDRLRRASSLLVAQNRALIDSLTSQTTVLSPISNKQLVQDELGLKSSPIPSTFADGPIAAGPPSLSSWVLNGEIWGAQAKNKESDRNVLKPIEEMASEEQRCLSISNDETTSVSTYCSPVPSAPLFPNDAVWFEHISAGFPLHIAATQHQPAYSPPSLSPGDAYNWGSPHIANLGSHSFQQDHHSIYTADLSNLDLLDGWSYNHPWATSSTTYFERSPPILHPSSPLLRGLHAQRESHASSPPLVDVRPEPQPLLQYLKQRERQLQQETQHAGLPFLRN